jgi:hypothetical protein
MITAEYTFSCTFPRCPEFFTSTADASMEGLSDAISEAQAKGWTIFVKAQSECFCPAHTNHIARQLIKNTEDRDRVNRMAVRKHSKIANGKRGGE